MSESAEQGTRRLTGPVDWVVERWGLTVDKSLDDGEQNESKPVGEGRS